MRSTARWAPSPLVAVAALVTTLTITTAGCGGAQVGAGLPTLAGDEVDSAVVPFEGIVRIGSQGCVMVDVEGLSDQAQQRWAVWPPGTELYVGSQDSGNGAVVDGQEYTRDVHIKGTGRIVDLAALPGQARRSGGYYAETGRYCGADRTGVVVIDTVERA